MPERVIRKIEREYEKKGKSAKQAKRIAYATLSKEGLLEHRKRRRKMRRKK